MDSAIARAPAEVLGRDTGLMWTAGDQAFWKHLAGHSSTPLDMPGTRPVPHVLKDGADSIGLGALVRV